MAELDARQRNALPQQAFAGPARSFPIENPDHAVAALRLVGRAQAAGHITPEEAAHIRNKAHAVLAAHNGYAGQIMSAAQPQRPQMRPAPQQAPQPQMAQRPVPQQPQ